jgi:hypothetical protein
MVPREKVLKVGIAFVARFVPLINRKNAGEERV